MFFLHGGLVPRSIFVQIDHFLPRHLIFGTQLQLLWWGMIGAGFDSIWHARNSICFKDSRPIVISLIHSIQLKIYEVNSWGLGIMRNSVDDLCLFHGLGIHGRSVKAPQIR